MGAVFNCSRECISFTDWNYAQLLGQVTEETETLREYALMSTWVCQGTGFFICLMQDIFRGWDRNFVMGVWTTGLFQVVFWLTLGRIIRELASSAYGGVSCLYQIKFGWLPTFRVVCIQRRRKHVIPCFCFYFFWLRSVYRVFLELHNPHWSLHRERA